MLAKTLFPGVAVLSGASGVGIGAHTARAFAREGCTRIAITDLNPDLLSQTEKALKNSSIHVQVLALPGDITAPKFITSFFKAVVDKFGRIDYAINSAGVLGQEVRSTEMQLSAFDAINDVNYRACWLSSRAELADSILFLCPTKASFIQGHAMVVDGGYVIN